MIEEGRLCDRISNVKDSLATTLESTTMRLSGKKSNFGYASITCHGFGDLAAEQLFRGEATGGLVMKTAMTSPSGGK
jgi:hypothetical protein